MCKIVSAQPPAKFNSDEISLLTYVTADKIEYIDVNGCRHMYMHAYVIC